LVLNEGKIEVLGKSQGSASLKIPGRDVGYMPQASIAGWCGRSRIGLEMLEGSGMGNLLAC